MKGGIGVVKGDSNYCSDSKSNDIRVFLMAVEYQKISACVTQLETWLGSFETPLRLEPLFSVVLEGYGGFSK